MSIIERTELLKLTQYSGSSLMAQFVLNYNEDMRKIDGYFGEYEDAINQRVSDLQTEVAQFEADVNASVGTLTDTVNGFDTRVTTIEGCCEDVNTTLLNYGSRLIEIERVIDTVSTANVDDLTERVNALENKVNANTSNINTVKVDVSDLKDRVSSLETKQVEDAQQIARNTGRIANLETCCQEVQTTLSELDSRITQNSGDIEALTERVAHDEGNITANAQDITILSGQVATNSADIEDLKSAFDELDPTSQFELVRQVAINTEAIGNLQGITTSHTTSITNLNTRMDSVESTVVSYESRIEDCERAASEIITYNQRIAEVEAEMQSCSDDVTQLTSDFGDLTTLVNGYNGRITQCESDISGIDTRVTSLEAYQTSATSAMSALTARVATNETDIDNLELADVAIDGRVTTVEGKATALETMCGDGNLNTTATDLTGGINEVNTLVTNADSKATQALSKATTLEGEVGAWSTSHPNDSITDVIGNMISTVADALHPVGSVYLTIGNTNPATLLGFGTWSALSDGYLRTGGANASGGSLDTGSTAITEAQLPAHTHSLSSHTHGWSNSHSHGITQTAHSHGGSFGTSEGNRGGSYGNVPVGYTTSTNGANANITINSASISGTTGAPSNNTSGSTGSGNGHTHSIEPTYTRVYAWERTA